MIDFEKIKRGEFHCLSDSEVLGGTIHKLITVASTLDSLDDEETWSNLDFRIGMATIIRDAIHDIDEVDNSLCCYLNTLKAGRQSVQAAGE